MVLSHETGVQIPLGLPVRPPANDNHMCWTVPPWGGMSGTHGMSDLDAMTQMYGNKLDNFAEDVSKA